MNPISDFFLRAKHWVIFILLFAPMAIGQIVVIIGIARVAADPHEELFARLMPVMSMAMLSFAIPLYTWFWAIGSFLVSVQQLHPKMNLSFFRFAVVFPLPYVCLFFFIGVWIIQPKINRLYSAQQKPA